VGRRRRARGAVSSMAHSPVQNSVQVGYIADADGVAWPGRRRRRSGLRAVHALPAPKMASVSQISGPKTRSEWSNATTSLRRHHLQVGGSSAPGRSRRSASGKTCVKCDLAAVLPTRSTGRLRWRSQSLRAGDWWWRGHEGGGDIPRPRLEERASEGAPRGTRARAEHVAGHGIGADERGRRLLDADERVGALLVERALNGMSSL